MKRRRAPVVCVALLRAINVGGKNIVSMKALKASFERLGFQDVTTYINSGNVLFRSTASDARSLERRIDRMLSRDYGLTIRTVVRTRSEIARLIDTMANTWRPDPQWRYNVIFLRHSVDSDGILDGIDLKPDIEEAVYCPGTLLWSARLNALTRTAMVKLSSRTIYQDMTVRSVNTTTKIFALMQRMEAEPTSRGGVAGSGRMRSR
jgi:uncharacterized protein (DUF1697 family)